MPDYLAPYNIIWDTPSANAGESMPCGGHDIGLNVWVEADEVGDGDLLFYMDRAGSFDENNQMLKLGRVRVRLTPNPFTPGAPFRQELKLRQGCIEITGGKPEVRIEVWVDVMQPAIHVEVHSEQPVMLEAGYENWRLSVREIPYERRHPCASLVAYAGAVTTEPDTVGFNGDSVLFYHRNRSDRLVRDILIPASLPLIFPGLRIGLGIGWMCVVTAELIAAQSGLGYMIQQNRVLLQTQNVVAGMVTIGIIGFAMSAAMGAIERRLIGWSQVAR